MGDVAAVPHAGDHVGERLAGRRAEAARELVGEPAARIEHRPVTVVEGRQHRVADDEHRGEHREHRRPRRHQPLEARVIERGLGGEHDPQPEKQPQRVAPHRESAAPADRRKRQHGGGRAERQQGDDPAVEGVGRHRCRRRRPRPGERRGDQQGRHQEEQLPEREHHRLQDVVEQPARGRGARAGVGERQEIVAHQPDQMRRHHYERDRERDPGAGRRQRLAGIAVDDQQQRHRRRQHDHEILRPQRDPDRKPEQRPIDQAAALEAGMEGVTGQRPERQLDHVVIELGGGVMKVVQAVDDQDRGQRAARADERQRGHPHRRQGADHRELRQRVIGGVASDHPVDGLDQPPGQRRQLVIAELPFAAVGQRLDQIERQVRIERRRQRGPDEKMHGEEHAKGRLWAAIDHVDERGHRRCGYPRILALAL